MELKDLIKKGLLGYQPIFFPNGVISGAGFQFFGNLRNMRASDPKAGSAQPVGRERLSFGVDDSDNFNRGRLGNLYVPLAYGDRSEFDSQFYYCVEEGDVGHFARYNLALLEMYRYFVSESLKLAATRGCRVESMIEVGSNTCLFPLAFKEAGVAECHGADIVDYSPVVDLLSEMKKQHVSFHHMKDDSEASWRSLPKADLVWSYAVVLHQSNPLAHLTRLASLARKAIFVMTICEPEEWRSEKDLGIRYLSANSYYNADFPNCFDVTVVSPELVRYSLKRLGFGNIFEIPNPSFDSLDRTGQADLDYWMKKHCFFLAFRDGTRDADALNDYSISTERSPFKGENVLVHTGFHHNVVLSSSRYFIVAHGKPLDPGASDSKSFSSLSNAMEYLGGLQDERSPYPIQVRSLKSHNLIRFKNRFYLCPHGRSVDFNDPADLARLSSMDTLEKWDKVFSVLDEAAVASLEGQIAEIVGNIVIVGSDDGVFHARRLEDLDRARNFSKSAGRLGALGRLARKTMDRKEHAGAAGPDQDAQQGGIEKISSTSLRSVIRKVSAGMLLDSMRDAGSGEVILYRHPDGRLLKRTVAGQIQVQDEKRGSVLSAHDDLEKAWGAILRT